MGVRKKSTARHSPKVARRNGVHTGRRKIAAGAGSRPKTSGRRTQPAAGIRLQVSKATEVRDESVKLKSVELEQNDEGREEPVKVHCGVLPVVGIGASAGGLEALREFFTALPDQTGVAFVVVTHQSPDHTSLLPELLAKFTSLKVIPAEDGQKLEPDNVYVAPPGVLVETLGGVLKVIKIAPGDVPHLSVDHFFRSLANDQREQAVCVVLSGTGSDGTLGLRAVKAESGMAMVQQPETAQYSGMPGNAVATGLADYILPAEKIPEQLLAYIRSTCSDMKLPAVSVLPSKEPLQRILALLKAHTGHDFSAYKLATILRRIERRIKVHNLGTMEEYLRYLHDNSHEIDRLFKEFLISVTSFFRDPPAFQALGEALMPLLESRPDENLRVWIPGCASGEEAYSVAILLSECMEKLKRPFKVQIFGTDLDAKAIETARAGVYVDGIAADLGRKRLARYFTFENNVYKIRKEIRELVVFAVQNVIKDPPFTKVDLVVCRNLLIYLENDLQHRLLTIFHYALRPGGLLFLGPSESIGNHHDLFETLDNRWKINRRQDLAAPVHPVISMPIELPKHNNDSQTRKPPAKEKQPTVAAQVEKLLLNQFAPTSVLTEDHGDIIYIHGRSGLYLEPIHGLPGHNLLAMARAGLAKPLEAALHQAAASKDKIVSRERVRVKTNGDYTLVDFAITRVEEPEAIRGLLLVTFRPSPPASSRTAAPVRRAGLEDGRVKGLKLDLQYAKESLQTTIEELETSNEELKSTNEELQSTNEELQSGNEELETSKEEMQSLNEELSTVNAELQAKLQELSHANDDMQNLLNGIQVATIFLDGQLNVKRYTEQALDLANLIATDIGRPLSDLASKLKYDHLTDDCTEVLRTLIPKTKEIRGGNGIWHLMRIMPYRTTENLIDGVVITLVDITERKRTEEALQRISGIFMAAADPILILGPECNIQDLNAETERTFGRPRNDLLGQPFSRLLPQEQQAQIDELSVNCREGRTIRNFQGQGRKQNGEVFPALISLFPLKGQEGRPNSMVMTIKNMEGLKP